MLRALDELTLPGFVHDVCSSVYPLALASPFFCSLQLADHGLDWIHPPVPLAHPFDSGTAVLLERSVESTADKLGENAAAYKKLMSSFGMLFNRNSRERTSPVLTLSAAT